jgi:hypothetical protein
MDRTTKPAIYAQIAVPHLLPAGAGGDDRGTSVASGDACSYDLVASGDRVTVTDPFAFDVAVANLRPRWAR